FHVTGVQTCALPIFIANVPTTLKAGTYTETIQPVANGWGYIPGQSLSYNVTVLEDYQQKWAGQSAYPTIKRGGTASGYIEYTNKIGRAACRESRKDK